MAGTETAEPIPRDVLESLELLLFGAIGMTTIALAEASASDLTLSQWSALVVIGRTDGIRVATLPLGSECHFREPAPFVGVGADLTRRP